jgi:hypothetical protein
MVFASSELCLILGYRLYGLILPDGIQELLRLIF